MTIAIAILIAFILIGPAPALAITEIVPLAAFSGVGYDFSTTTNTFTAPNASPPGVPGFSLNALFDDSGVLQSGIFEYHNATASLLLASIDHVGVVEQDVFFAVRFYLDALTVNPILGLDFDEAIFEAQVRKGPIPLGPFPRTVEELFTTDYSNARVPLNSFLLAIVEVPHMPTASLLSTGLVLLIVIARCRTMSPANGVRNRIGIAGTGG
jgi:hypothetical protein